MTEKLTGNEAVARGIYEAGVEIATSHPGTPSNGIIEILVQYDDIYVEWSVNEKVAAEVAIGASIAGKRSIELKAEGIQVYGKNIFPKHGTLSQEVIKKSFNREQIAFRTGKPENRKMCAGCPYRGLFYALKQVLPKSRKYFVAGDVGCDHHAELKPFSFMDSQIAMGSSIGNIAGFQQATQLKYSVAIIGDGAFLHSGMNALLNMVYNKSKGTIIVLDNGAEATVNGQSHAGSGYTLRGESAKKIDYVKLCEALGVEYVRTVDPYNLSQTQIILKEELNREALSVIISSAPCVKYVRKSTIGEPKSVDLDKCVGCGTCLDVSCPAIHLKGKMIWHRKSKIDTEQCIGCGVCSQVCPYGAII